MRHLTYETDKLPALSRVADKLHRRIHDRYLAGLRKRNFLGGLLWYTIGLYSNRAEKYRRPLWSWVSVEGHQIVHLTKWFLHQEHKDAQVVKVECLLASQDPFREASTGYLRLFASLMPAELKRDRVNAWVNANGLNMSSITDYRPFFQVWQSSLNLTLQLFLPIYE